LCVYLSGFSTVGAYTVVCVCVCVHVCVCVRLCVCVCASLSGYGVASVSRIDKIVGLFCKRALQKRRYSAKETYNLIDPTDRSYLMTVATPYEYLCFLH